MHPELSSKLYLSGVNSALDQQPSRSVHVPILKRAKSRSHAHSSYRRPKPDIFGGNQIQAALRQCQRFFDLTALYKGLQAEKGFVRLRRATFRNRAGTVTRLSSARCLTSTCIRIDTGLMVKMNLPEATRRFPS